MLVGIACLGFLYAPLLTFLRAPPTKEEKKVGDPIPNGTSATNVVTAITSDDTTEKKGIYNLAVTLDNGDLALPQLQPNSTITHRTPTEQHITRL